MPVDASRLIAGIISGMHCLPKPAEEAYEAIAFG